MSQHSISHSLLNVVLILAESAITLVLRLDPNLRRAVYPLAKKNTIVCIRTYLPHVEIYATFTTKGVLLDSTLTNPNREADVIVNAYSHQLLNALISNDVTQVNKLTMRGPTETVAQVRLFLIQLGLAGLVQGIIKGIKGKKGHSGDGKSTESTHDNVDYKARIEEQQKQINTLSIRNRELEVGIKEAQSKHKMLMIALGVVVLIAIAAIIGWIA